MVVLKLVAACDYTITTKDWDYNIEFMKKKENIYIKLVCIGKKIAREFNSTF